MDVRTYGFSATIFNFPYLSYQERFTVLNLETLEYRHLSSDLTMYYESCHILTPWFPSDYFNIVIPPYFSFCSS